MPAAPATSSVLRTVIWVGFTTLSWIFRSTISATWWFVTSDSTAAAWLQTVALSVFAHILWTKFMEAKNGHDGINLMQLLSIDSMRSAMDNLLDTCTDLIEWCIKYGLIRGKLAANWVKRQNKKRVDELVEKVKAGDGGAAYILGMWFQHGLRGLPRSNNKAYQFFKTAGNYGSIRGLNAHGSCLVHGTGVERNTTHGVSLTTSAAEQGCDKACFNLGLWYASGEHDLPMDREEAQNWLQRAVRGPFDVRDLTATQIRRAREVLAALAAE